MTEPRELTKEEIETLEREFDFIPDGEIRYRNVVFTAIRQQKRIAELEADEKPSEYDRGYEDGVLAKAKEFREREEPKYISSLRQQCSERLKLAKEEIRILRSVLVGNQPNIVDARIRQLTGRSGRRRYRWEEGK